MKSKPSIVLSFLILASLPSFAQGIHSENLVIVTLDGFRWQELFTGEDSSILFNKEFTPDASSISTFWNSDPYARRKRLLPFLWNVIADQGQVYGNRLYGNQVNCANPYWFSYPGYSEMLTGIVDKKMASNRKVENPNTNVLEYINNQKGYEGRVAAFSTWDVIPYVIRASSNGIYTNSDKDIACLEMNKGDQKIADYPTGKRCDESTFYAAFEYLKIERPKVMFLSFDGTDDHSHGGRYGEYLIYANKADKMISELWYWLQSQECYRDKTTLMITTDHGRGRGARGSWKTHGRWAAGSNQMWMAVLGPDTPPLGEMKTNAHYFQKQIAKTAASFLNMDFVNGTKTGTIIKSMAYPLVESDKKDRLSAELTKEF